MATSCKICTMIGAMTNAEMREHLGALGLRKGGNASELASRLRSSCYCRLNATGRKPGEFAVEKRNYLQQLLRGAGRSRKGKA